MNYAKTKLETDKTKNKPNYIAAAINTFFAFVLLVVVLVLFFTSKGQFPVSLLIFCLVLVVLYPLASWLNSVVLKKMNLRRIENYEKETEILVKYVRRYESYKAFDYPKEVKLTFIKTNDLDINQETPIFHKDSCNFSTPRSSTILLTFGVTFAGVEINKDTGIIENLSGVMPRSIWYYKKLKPPKATPMKLKVDFNNFPLTQKMVIHALKRADIYYDNKTGWLAIGERKVTVIDDAYEVSKNVVLVLREQELMSVWIKLEPGLMVK